jgi:peroxiredoxin Q/BCP
MTRRLATSSRRWTVALATLLATCSLWSGGLRAQTPARATGTPKVGDKAADFTLRALDGTTVQLSKEVATRDPIVLVVLRGWPGYQCPFCTRQFGDYLANAERFAKIGARVLFIYPGPGEGLESHAQAFTASREMPKAFRILLDPDYAYTNAYGLRWNAPQETAFPSTFVVDRNGVVTFAEISRTHGDRVKVDTVLTAVARITRSPAER